MFDTIAAISTGFINQPISIIRISGSESFKIVKKIFTGKIGLNKTITHGYIQDTSNNIVDEVLISWFKGSKTFTGEDIVEINAHGGVVNTNKILKLILANGARMALPGEFSKRAFLNGKMDLIKAEAIHDLIFAKTEEQASLSIKKFDGKTSDLIEKLKNKLLNIIAICETNIDYPEYDDIEILTSKKLFPKLENIKNNIEEILESSKSSRYIYEGVKVAIVGRPNAGKSSLLNALINEDKAIVTNVPGTTRDIVEGEIQIGQVLLKFKDTAGIHTTKNKIEKIGIEKSLQQIDDSDLVIHVIDGQKGEDHDDLIIEKSSKFKSYIKVFNKSDLQTHTGINISAKNKKIDKLITAINSIYKNINLSNEKVLTNTRQLALIESAKISIEDAINGLKNGLGPEIVIIDIQKSWDNLANILGRANQEKLLDEMFSNFCLGK